MPRKKLKKAPSVPVKKQKTPLIRAYRALNLATLPSVEWLFFCVERAKNFVEKTFATVYLILLKKSVRFIKIILKL